MTRKFIAIVVALVICVTAIGTSGYDYRGDDVALLEYINTLCETYELPPQLIYAMIERESSWKADALNAAGNCIGLMQISTVNLDWLEESLGVEDLYDPYQNVLSGITMIASYIDTYGDYHMALMCYNCGSGGAQKLFDQGIYSSSYSRWIVERMEELQAQDNLITTEAAPESTCLENNGVPVKTEAPSIRTEAHTAQEEKQESEPEKDLLHMIALDEEKDELQTGIPGSANVLLRVDGETEEWSDQESYEESSCTPLKSSFTVIYARDNLQQEPSRLVCSAISAK